MKFSTNLAQGDSLVMTGPSQFVAVTCSNWDGIFQISYPGNTSLPEENHQIGAYATETVVPKTWPAKVRNLSESSSVILTAGQA